jgi:hypothetical protein
MVADAVEAGLVAIARRHDEEMAMVAAKGAAQRRAVLVV